MKVKIKPDRVTVKNILDMGLISSGVLSRLNNGLLKIIPSAEIKMQRKPVLMNEFVSTFDKYFIFLDPKAWPTRIFVAIARPIIADTSKNIIGTVVETAANAWCPISLPTQIASTTLYMACNKFANSIGTVK